MKDRDIVDVNFDGDDLIIDLRYKIPKELCSGELIVDLMNMKNDFVNGSFVKYELDGTYYLKYQARVEERENGDDYVVFTKNSIKLQ